MELVHVDAIEAKPLETAFDGFGEMLWAGIVQPLKRSTALPSTLGGHDESGRVRVQGLGNQLFGNIRTIRVGGIDEVDAQFNGPAQSGKRLRLVFGGAPNPFPGDPHGSVTQAIDGEVSTESNGSGCCGGDRLGLSHAKAPSR